MRRLLILIAAVGLLAVGALPALAQPSPVDEVAPIVVERPPARPAIPAGPVSPGVAAPPAEVSPGVVTPGTVTPGTVTPARTVRVAGAEQLARTGIDATTAAGAAALLLIIGGSVLLVTRRRSVQI